MAIHGKTVVITGASSGIGEAAARALARRGAIVCLVSRRQEELERIRTDLVREGGRAFVYAADLTDGASIDACADRILAEHSRIDVLVNNAGRSIRRSIVDSLTRVHDYERTMQVNYFGAVRFTLKLLPRFLDQGRGHVINSSSMSTQIPLPMFSAYLASKSALDSFSRSLAAELGDRGIAVTSIHYPLVYTPMSTRTNAYSRARMMSPEHAADWIVRAIERRPARIGLVAGTLGSMLLAAIPGPTTRWSQPWFRAMSRRVRGRGERKAG